MDEINQIQNPNISPMPGQSMGPTPSMPSASMMPMKKKNYWFWMVIAVILVVGGLAWWYVSSMAVDAPFVQQPQIDKEAREDAMISKDIEGTDSTNVDAEFQPIDKDLNSL